MYYTYLEHILALLYRAILPADLNSIHRSHIKCYFVCLSAIPQQVSWKTGVVEGGFPGPAIPKEISV